MNAVAACDHLQMLVTEARLLIVAIILRLEKRPAPRGTSLRDCPYLDRFTFLNVTLTFLSCCLRAAGEMPSAYVLARILNAAGSSGILLTQTL